MLEIEMKFRVPDWEFIVDRMNTWNAKPDPLRKDSDHYFNAPDRDFAQTDEAVRIRQIGTSNFLTYKGPKIDRETKTRLEVELPIAEGAEAAATAVRFLSGLGFRPVSAVMKTRQVYRLNRGGFDVSICLDDVGAVGRFVELEIMAEAEQLQDAKAVLAQMAQELNLTDTERRSYLQLLLDLSEKRNAT